MLCAGVGTPSPKRLPSASLLTFSGPIMVGGAPRSIYILLNLHLKCTMETPGEILYSKTFTLGEIYGESLEIQPA